MGQGAVRDDQLLGRGFAAAGLPADQHVPFGQVDVDRFAVLVAAQVHQVEVGYTPSYISKVESGHRRPSRSFADLADKVLRTGGALSRSIRESASHHREGQPEDPSQGRDPGAQTEAQTSSLIVEHDDAGLTYDDHTYHAFQRRKLFNASREPVTRYLIRISVDRYPGDPERSNQLYRANPLT